MHGATTPIVTVCASLKYAGQLIVSGVKRRQSIGRSIGGLRRKMRTSTSPRNQTGIHQGRGKFSSHRGWRGSVVKLEDGGAV